MLQGAFASERNAVLAFRCGRRILISPLKAARDRRLAAASPPRVAHEAGRGGCRLAAQTAPAPNTRSLATRTRSLGFSRRRLSLARQANFAASKAFTSTTPRRPMPSARRGSRLRAEGRLRRSSPLSARRRLRPRSDHRRWTPARYWEPAFGPRLSSYRVLCSEHASSGVWLGCSLALFWREPSHPSEQLAVRCEIHGPMLDRATGWVAQQVRGALPGPRRTNRSRTEIATTVGTDVLDDLGDAACAKRALEAANRRFRRARRERLVTVLTSRPQFQHRFLPCPTQLVRYGISLLSGYACPVKKSGPPFNKTAPRVF